MSAPAAIRNYPNLSLVYDRQVARTPSYETSLVKRMTDVSPGEMEILERHAVQILKLVGNELDEYCDDYQWICEIVLQEELEFRRNGRYRLSSFQEAYEQVYSNAELMRHYMNGLLMTQLWWSNHTNVFDYFEKSFIPRLKQGYRHLEIGTGHGMYMFPPALDPRCGSLTAWDISEQSANATIESLRRIGVTNVNVVLQDMFAADPAKVGNFDSIVFSEVLEHLEKPSDALKQLRNVLSDEGFLFVHMPVNSPAPDHIFLLRSPEAVVDFVKEHGFEVVDTRFEPQTGMTLEAARAKNKTISAALIARKSR